MSLDEIFGSSANDPFYSSTASSAFGTAPPAQHNYQPPPAGRVQTTTTAAAATAAAAPQASPFASLPPRQSSTVPQTSWWGTTSTAPPTATSSVPTSFDWSKKDYRNLLAEVTPIAPSRPPVAAAYPPSQAAGQATYFQQQQQQQQPPLQPPHQHGKVSPVPTVTTAPFVATFPEPAPAPALPQFVAAFPEPAVAPTFVAAFPPPTAATVTTTATTATSASPTQLPSLQAAPPVVAVTSMPVTMDPRPQLVPPPLFTPTEAPKPAVAPVSATAAPITALPAPPSSRGHLAVSSRSAFAAHPEPSAATTAPPSSQLPQRSSPPRTAVPLPKGNPFEDSFYDQFAQNLQQQQQQRAVQPVSSATKPTPPSSTALPALPQPPQGKQVSPVIQAQTPTKPVPPMPPVQALPSQPPQLPLKSVPQPQPAVTEAPKDVSAGRLADIPQLAPPKSKSPRTRAVSAGTKQAEATLSSTPMFDFDPSHVAQPAAPQQPRVVSPVVVATAPTLPQPPAAPISPPKPLPAATPVAPPKPPLATVPPKTRDMLPPVEENFFQSVPPPLTATSETVPPSAGIRVVPPSVPEKPHPNPEIDFFSAVRPAKEEAGHMQSSIFDSESFSPGRATTMEDIPRFGQPLPGLSSTRGRSSTISAGGMSDGEVPELAQTMPALEPPPVSRDKKHHRPRPQSPTPKTEAEKEKEKQREREAKERQKHADRHRHKFPLPPPLDHQDKPLPKPAEAPMPPMITVDALKQSGDKPLPQPPAKLPPAPPPKPVQLPPAATAAAEATHAEPLIPREALAEYRRAFAEHAAPGEKISGDAVKEAWKGKRPNAELKRIFVLAKRNAADEKPGMAEAEFVLGMHLIAERNHGAELPATISEELWRQVEQSIAEAQAQAPPTALSAEHVPAVAVAPSEEQPRPGKGAPPVHRERKPRDGGWKLPPKDLVVDSDPETDMEPGATRSTPGTPEYEAVPPEAPLSDRPAPLMPHPLPEIPQQRLSTAPAPPATITPVEEGGPPLPPRERVQLTGIEAWLTEHNMDAAIREAFRAKKVKLVDLWDLSEDELVAYGVGRLSQRLAIYYGIWLSRKTLPPAPGKKQAASSAAGPAHSPTEVPADAQEVVHSTSPQPTKMQRPPSLTPMMAPANTLRSGKIKKLEAPPKLVIMGQTKGMDEKKARTADEAARECAGVLQELLVGGTVRSWFQERGSERRKVVEELLAAVQLYNGQIAALKNVLVDAFRERSALTEDEFKLFAPLLDTAVISTDLYAAASVLMKRWNRVSCISDLFNDSLRRWESKFATFFMARGKTIHELETACNKRSKLKSALRSCEERLATCSVVSSGGRPVSILTFFEKPSVHILSLIDVVSRLRAATHYGHPDAPGLDALLYRLRHAQQNDEQMRLRDGKARKDLQSLAEIAIRLSSCPKGFVAYGRYFVADGEVQQMRTDEKKKATSQKFLLFNDMMLLGTTKGKHFSTKTLIDFAAATIRDVPDGTPFAGSKVTNGWAINAPDTIILYTLAADEKGALFNLMRTTIETYKADVVKRRGEASHIIATGL